MNKNNLIYNLCSYALKLDVRACFSKHAVANGGFSTKRSVVVTQRMNVMSNFSASLSAYGHPYIQSVPRMHGHCLRETQHLYRMYCVLFTDSPGVAVLGAPIEIRQQCTEHRIFHGSIPHAYKHVDM